MEMTTTKVFDRLINNVNNRYFIFYGGSSSSKTISILQYLTLYAFKYPNKRITISAESTPVIRKTLLADWKDVVMKELYDHNSFNGSEMIYRFPNGSVFQFIPADEPARWHGLRQDVVYFDEVYNVKEEIYSQADIRTKEKVFCSFNPTSQFWIQDRFNDDNTYVDHSTYHDNQYISQPIIDALEKRLKSDVNFYSVYVLGEWGNTDGLIFKEGLNWFVTNELPIEWKKRVYGLDFGFSVDPTALIDIKYSNGNLYLEELIYRTNMTNQDIAPYLDFKTIADSAEPKSIEEIRRLGVDILPAVKGPGSINTTIKALLGINIYVHKESINLIKEFRNYMWDKNRSGETLVKPKDTYNHGIDAIRYGSHYMFAQERNLMFI